MTNTNIEEINSVCTTSRELIASDDFTIGLEIILGQTKTFNNDYILSLFNKLQKDGVLTWSEKNDLLKFASDDKVSKLGQEFLSNLKSVPVDILSELNTFSALLNDLFLNAGIGYSGNSESAIDKELENNANSVSNILEKPKLTLNAAYIGMKKLQIEVNGETREIYLDNENFRVDSSTWDLKKINGHNVKINPEGDIIEFLDGPEVGQQLFKNTYAINRELTKLGTGKRLPFADDENKEFQAIIKKVGAEEFMKFFPGLRDNIYEGEEKIKNRGKTAFFWCDPIKQFKESRTSSGFRSANFVGDAYAMVFDNRQNSKSYRTLVWGIFGLSIRLVKDIK